MAKRLAGNATKYFLGFCVPTTKENAAKVRIQSLSIHHHLHMMYNEQSFVYANDPAQRTKPGDVVLIRSLPQKLTRLIEHEIVEVVYPLGDITDPITMKKISASRYRDEIKELSNLMGRLDSTFDYDSAPPRGAQEGKRDFSHKVVYRKYHEDPDDPQPFAV